MVTINTYATVPIEGRYVPIVCLSASEPLEDTEFRTFIFSTAVRSKEEDEDEKRDDDDDDDEEEEEEERDATELSVFNLYYAYLRYYNSGFTINTGTNGEL